MSPPRFAALVACLASAAGAAQARDMSGRFGIGGQVDTGFLGEDDEAAQPLPNVSLSLRYWVSDFGLQLLFSIRRVQDEVAPPADTPETPAEPGAEPSDEAEPATHLEYAPALRLLYAMTRARATNLYVGVGLAGRFPKRDKDPAGAAFFEVLLGVEHFFARTFSVSGHVTLSVELASDPERTFESPGWGGSFHYYF